MEREYAQMHDGKAHENYETHSLIPKEYQTNRQPNDKSVSGESFYDAGKHRFP